MDKHVIAIQFTGIQDGDSFHRVVGQIPYRHTEGETLTMTVEPGLITVTTNSKEVALKAESHIRQTITDHGGAEIKEN